MVHIIKKEAIIKEVYELLLSHQNSKDGGMEELLDKAEEFTDKIVFKHLSPTIQERYDSLVEDAKKEVKEYIPDELSKFGRAVDGMDLNTLLSVLYGIKN